MIFSLSKIKFTKTWFCSFKLTCHYTKEALCVFVSVHHVLQSSDRVDNIVDSGGKRSISFPHPETSQSPQLAFSGKFKAHRNILIYTNLYLQIVFWPFGEKFSCQELSCTFCKILVSEHWSIAFAISVSDLLEIFEKQTIVSLNSVLN